MSRLWCLVNLSPAGIRRGGRLAEHMTLSCRGGWGLVAVGGGILPLLSGYLGLMVEPHAPIRAGG